MANNILVNGVVVKQALRLLRNKLPMAMMANKDYQDDITDTNARNGGQVFVKRPPRYTGRDGELMQVESTVETAVPMTLKMAGQDVSFSAKDLQLSMDDVARGGLDHCLDSAMTTIAARIELAGTGLYTQVANTVGTPGVLPTDKIVMFNGNALIDSLGGTIGGEKMAILDTFASASLANGVTPLFNPTRKISDAYLSGYIGDIGGFGSFADPAIQSFTAGVYGGTPVVNGAGQSGNTLITSGWTAGSILNAGDTFTIGTAGTANAVNAVNPQTRQSIGKLLGFVAANQAVADGSGNMTITLGAQGLIPSGQFQNVTLSPAASAAITVTSGTSGQTSRQSLLYDKNAITFACVPLAKPAGGNFEYSVAKDKMSGLAISAITAYDQPTNQVRTRFDVLYAWLLSYPELVVRLQG